MEAIGKHDDLFLDILKEEGQIIPFLNAVFGFLFRRTDFYCVQEREDEKIGFPPGMAERIVRSVFMKWKQLLHHSPDELDIPMNVVAEEVTIDSCEEPVETAKINNKCNRDHREEKPSASDTYNGADCGNYQWSQSIADIDVQVPVKPHVLKTRDIDVEIEMDHIKVTSKTDSGEWEVLVDGDLLYRNAKYESVWSLQPGRCISIHLDKTEERWWEALLTSEKRLDPKSIDASRCISELGQEEQMKIHELMWNEERKRQGLLTAQQLEAEKLMKKLNIDTLPVQSGALNVIPREELPDT